ncbi:MAG: MoxR family ATPase [Defluviitaleaceae bacterium]|nr:MoxR family ATPase [Defluviitaleaceae bacterium]MCL2240824.1 MoxR family ATPase [Defluviitaleaceae bacterium]
MHNNISKILDEVEKVVIGKREVIVKILTAILAHGHILLDDVPGIGKTTLAVALSRTLGLTFGRVQFTPDVLPSDITGFSIYSKSSDSFTYKPGIAVGVHLLLGDEINRTSSKTQSALLEAMEEGQVTVDGESHPLKKPFIVIATQNNVGTAGTQLLPYAQLDRFLIKLGMGYPSRQSEMDIISGRQTANPVDAITCVATVENLVRMQHEVLHITVKDSIVDYIARLAEASRSHPWLELGISPRGSLFVNKMAKARAYATGRDYVIPEDVLHVFLDVCAHRIILSQAAREKKITAERALCDLLDEVRVPDGLKC